MSLFTRDNLKKSEIQSCPTLCNPMDCSLPHSSVHGIFQARILEWVAISFSSVNIKKCFVSSCAKVFKYSRNTHTHTDMCARSVASTLCHPMDHSPPGSSVHGILQARILERVAIPFSRGSSRPRNRTRVSCTAGRFFTI